MMLFYRDSRGRHPPKLVRRGWVGLLANTEPSFQPHLTHHTKKPEYEPIVKNPHYRHNLPMGLAALISLLISLYPDPLTPIRRLYADFPTYAWNPETETMEYSTPVPATPTPRPYVIQVQETYTQGKRTWQIRQVFDDTPHPPKLLRR